MVIDTDVVIRYLTDDDPQKAEKFRKFITSGRSAFLTDMTFAEIYWTLKSYYQFPKAKIIEVLTALITSSAIECDHDLLDTTLRILKENNLSFIDAYTAAYSSIKDNGTVLSYDHDFDKLKEIKRQEP